MSDQTQKPATTASDALTTGTTIHAVAFDVVGTLIYADPPVDEVYHRVGRRHGSRRSRTEILVGFKEAFRDLEHQLIRESDSSAGLKTSEATERERWRQIVNRVLPDAADGACFDELFEHFARPESWSCFPDVAETIDRLQAARIPICLATNFDARLDSICPGLPPLDLIELRVVSSRVGLRKPDNGFFDAVARTLNTEARRILFVGDDPVNDFAGATAAGMQALQVVRKPGIESRDRQIRDLRILFDHIL